MENFIGVVTTPTMIDEIKNTYLTTKSRKAAIDKAKNLSSHIDKEDASDLLDMIIERDGLEIYKEGLIIEW